MGSEDRSNATLSWKPANKEDAAAWADRYRPAANERETQFRAALTSAAAYLALMAGSVIRQDQVHADDLLRLRSAQLLLSVLYGVVLLYYVAWIRGASIAIADEGARRLELEEDGLLPFEESRTWDGVRRRREGSRTMKLIPRRFWGIVPRKGASQRQGAVCVVLTALLPIAWFSLREPPDRLLDALIIGLTATLTIVCLRLSLVGCRHWWWVSHWDYSRRRSAFDDSVARGWWRELLKSQTQLERGSPSSARKARS